MLYSNSIATISFLPDYRRKSLIGVKKSKSYKRELGRIAPDLLKMDFISPEPCNKWATDITEFKVRDKKLYLSPIIELFNGEIISYTLYESPNFK